MTSPESSRGPRTRAVLPRRKRRSKYGNVKAVGFLGELYDSKAEREYAAVLEHRRGVPGAGIISRWSWAPRFVLQDEPLITVRWDFVVWDANGMHVVDVKGHPSRDWSLRVRLWKSRHPEVPLIVVRNGQEEVV